MPDTLAIEILRPEAVGRTEQSRPRSVRAGYAEGMLDLIRRGVISTGYDGQLSGISVDALLRKLQQHGSPIANYSKDELRSEPEATLNDFDVQNPSCY